MQIEISYNRAKRHPKQVKEILAKLRKGKSKNKDADPKNLSWSYSVSEVCNGDDLEYDDCTVRVKDVLLDTFARLGISLEAKIGKWRGLSTIKPYPPFKDELP